MPRRLVWLDCDPGHDDAIAILLGLYCPNIQLIGVSTCHGNAPPENTHINAVRLLNAFNAPVDVHAHRGASKPLLRPVRADPEIHGDDGLGGVEELLPGLEDPAVQERWQLDGKRGAVEGMRKAIKNFHLNGHKVCIATTGPMTNLALFFTMHPDMIGAIDEVVFMGGGVGVGNRSAVAEYNILCDPEAAQIVLNTPVKKTMMPLNVTHTAIFTSTILKRLLDPTHPTETETPLPEIDMDLAINSNASPLRKVLATIILFFASTYKHTFNFQNGPPLHDALTIAYLSQPELFKVKRYRVDVELEGKWTTGETVVDIWGYRDGELTDLESWGPEGRNCLVAESADIAAFWELLLKCVDRCDKMSPLNL